MGLKHKSEWPELIKYANDQSLQNDEIILLLSLRELEDGKTGNEFNLIEVKDTCLEMQAINTLAYISKADKQYVRYIANMFKDVKKLDEAPDAPSFVKFFLEESGSYGWGWPPDRKVDDKDSLLIDLNLIIKEVEKEFTHGEGK